MCDLVEERDDEGSVTVFKVYQGINYPRIFIGNVKDHLESIKDMEVRDDDTFILSYPKSGTHWISGIVNMLRRGNVSYTSSPEFLDFNTIESLNNLPSPRVFASHMTFDFLPRQVKERRGKVIVIFRNTKDAAVSLYQFMIKLNTGFFFCISSWNRFLKHYTDGKMPYGSWFDSLLEWEKTQKTYDGKNILYIKYEDMKEDLQGNVAKISSFWGENHNKTFLDDVTNSCTFENMQQAVLDESHSKEQWEEVSATRILPIYRKGEVGDWKNYFTVAQNEKFDKLYNDKMEDSSFTFKFV